MAIRKLSEPRAQGGPRNPGRSGSKKPFRNTLAVYVEHRPNGDQTLQVDAKSACDHLAWRLAHFINDTADEPEKRTAQHLAAFFGNHNVRLVFPRDESGSLTLAFELKGLGGVAIPAQMVSKSAELPALSRVIEDIYEYADDGIGRTAAAECKPLPDKPQAGQEAFFHEPTEADLDARNRPIQAALRGELAVEYFGPDAAETEETEVTARMKWASFDRSSKAWDALPYSKTYTRLEDGAFDRTNNPNASKFFFKPQANRDLDEHVESSFRDSSFTTIGRPVFYEPFKDVRRKKSESERLEYADDGKLKEPDGLLKNRIKKAFGSEDLAWVPGLRFIFGTLLDQDIRYVPLDIDDFQLSRAYDLSTEAEAAFEEVRAALPRALQRARMRCSLSSSAGMRKRDDGTYEHAPVTRNLRGRLWAELDRPVDPEKFKEVMNLLRPKLVDGGLYTANQAVYGDPVFKGAEDPLALVRHFSLPGRQTAELDVLLAEFEVVQEQERKANQVDRPAPSGIPKTPTMSHTARRTIETSAGTFRTAIDSLEAIGDRRKMAALSKSGTGTHFSALQYIITRHLHRAFDDNPAMEPLLAHEVADPPDSPLGVHVRILNSAVVERFAAAAADPELETTRGHFQEYGLAEDGAIDPAGKYADMVSSACKHVSKERLERAEQAARRMRSSDVVSSKELESYRRVCLLETAVSGLLIEAHSGCLVLDGGDHVYIDDPHLPEERRFSGLEGSRRSALLPGSDAYLESEIGDLEFVESVSEMVNQRKTANTSLDRKKAFCAGMTQHQAREEIRERYTRPRMKLRKDLLGSKSPAPAPAPAPAKKDAFKRKVQKPKLKLPRLGGLDR
ncbi:hypothetical protein [Citreimonas salinaria]|uniref:Uncharacterized protein n=1 Tax=Citreimonas salinaria TaxID=321339 RepID=A0A1H3N6S1_9RHOB|nr:hypothetical protein [Citreimonas salinaria]SDY84661.1 hypothetical protein SAMN05444340_12114 [Citreimonas salinaria]